MRIAILSCQAVAACLLPIVVCADGLAQDSNFVLIKPYNFLLDGSQAARQSETVKPVGVFSYAEGNSYKINSTYQFSEGVKLSSIFGNQSADARGMPTAGKGYWNTQLKTEALGFLPKIDATVATSSFDPETSDGFGDDAHRMMRLAMSNAWRDYAFGLTYQQVGRKYEDPKYLSKSNIQKLAKDRQGYEFWVERPFGSFSLRPYLKLGHNNLSNNPKAPTVTDNESGVTLNYTFSHWPNVGASFTYGQGSAEISTAPADYQAFREPSNKFSTSLYFSADHWSGSIFAEWLKSQADGLTTRYQPATTTYYLEGSYYPVDSFTLSAAAGQGLEDYGESSRFRWQSTYLSLSYEPPGRRYKFSLYGQYDRQNNPAWQVDANYVYSEAAIDWRLNRSKRKPQWLKLAFTFDRYRDAFDAFGGPAVWLTFSNFEGPPLLYNRADARGALPAALSPFP